MDPRLPSFLCLVRVAHVDSGDSRGSRDDKAGEPRVTSYMLKCTADHVEIRYASAETILFQRLTVIISEVLLAYAAYRLSIFMYLNR
jgi:hypothetical protein